MRHAFVLLLLALPAVSAAPLTLEPGMRHLRIDGPREWSDFPEKPFAAALELAFDSQPNAAPWTLRLRQQDVKLAWNVTLNGVALGRLDIEGTDRTLYLDIPAGSLRRGRNVLRVEQDTSRGAIPDDIRVGEITLDDRPRDEVLGEATLEVTVRSADNPSPARITIVNADGALQTVLAEPDSRLAIRSGAVYTATGKALVRLPTGRYTVHAGRGFEYSISTRRIALEPGATATLSLEIERQVPTSGWVASDTHIHTYTHSGHGDATLDERLVTLAAEGIELPIATDHNLHVDYEEDARRLGLRGLFTPVIGCEVTTPTAHFNVFPVAAADLPPADHRSRDWRQTLSNIFATPGVKVAILNHARDLHSGVRPFDPSIFDAETGQALDGRTFAFNAMETINSGATQTDPLQLFHDWMALLRRGLRVTPVGSSDSHDVSRSIVGQGRTYIRADDSNPGAIDVEQAVYNFLQGRVMVSYGLLAELSVNDKYGPGETVPVLGDEVTVKVRVLGPDWAQADRILLYENGRVIREAPIAAGDRSETGVLWSGGWVCPAPPGTRSWSPLRWARASRVSTGGQQSPTNRCRPIGLPTRWPPPARSGCNSSEPEPRP